MMLANCELLPMLPAFRPAPPIPPAPTTTEYDVPGVTLKAASALVAPPLL